MVRPKLLTSACLEFEKIRYDGQMIPSKIVRDLMPFADFVKVCPEYEIGLGVPREPVRIVKSGEEYRLIQHGTNKDVTEEMVSFTRSFLNRLEEVDGFIFKSRSPSMGLSNIKVYSGMKGSPVIGRCNGFFAGEVMERFADYPIEDEDRLRNRTIRHHFLTRLFMMAALREARGRGDLKGFHTTYGTILRFYNPETASRLDPKQEEYASRIREMTRHPPSFDGMLRFFKECKDSVTDTEAYGSLLRRYEDNRISFETMREGLRLLARDGTFAKDVFFTPYPEELVDEVEQDRGRDYWKSR